MVECWCIWWSLIVRESVWNVLNVRRAIKIVASAKLLGECEMMNVEC